MPIPRILVAGNTGQVARALQDRNDPETFALTAYGRPQMDIASLASVQSAFDKVRPNLVINAAAYTGVDQAEDEAALAHAVNAEGATNLAKASAASDIPILHLSTDYVFDGTKTDPYVESDPVAPLGVYGASKLAGEQGVAAANSKHLILRTSWVYSPYGKNFVKTMLRLAETRDELRVVSDQIGNPTSAHDIADALLDLASQLCAAPDKMKPGIYHMSGQTSANWAELAAEALTLSAEHGRPTACVIPITSAEYPTRVKRPANSRLNCQKLAQDYAIELPDWKTSLRTCLDYLINSEG